MQTEAAVIERLTATFLAKDAKGVQYELSELTEYQASADQDLRPVVQRYVDQAGRPVHRVSANEFETASGVQLTVVRE